MLSPFPPSHDWDDYKQRLDRANAAIQESLALLHAVEELLSGKKHFRAFGPADRIPQEAGGIQ